MRGAGCRKRRSTRQMLRTIHRNRIGGRQLWHRRRRRRRLRLRRRWRRWHPAIGGSLDQLMEARVTVPSFALGCASWLQRIIPFRPHPRQSFWLVRIRLQRDAARAAAPTLIRLRRAAHRRLGAQTCNAASSHASGDASAHASRMVRQCKRSRQERRGSLPASVTGRRILPHGIPKRSIGYFDGRRSGLSWRRRRRRRWVVRPDGTVIPAGSDRHRYKIARTASSGCGAPVRIRRVVPRALEADSSRINSRIGNMSGQG